MKDPLLDFYERELAFIREEGREFARRNPKIAGRLRLSDAENVEDPHVSRLIEAFALLCARLRIKMQDEFPEICQSLLQALYPQYLAPVPPVSVCQLELSDLSLDVPGGRVVRRGERLETEAVDGVQCVFRMVFETQLLPLSIAKAEYLEHPLPFEIDASWKDQVEAAIRLTLVSQSEKLPLADMQFEQLRFHLGGSTALGSELYEALFRDSVGMMLKTPDNRATLVARQAIRPVGFANDQGLLEHDPRTINAYRLLWEFFACPAKFRFADLAIGSKWQSAIGTNSSVDLILLFNRSHPLIQRELRADTLRLGCSPIINLFEQTAESFRLVENKNEYRVIPNARKPLGTEVISIDQVHATSPGGQEKRKFKPFYLPSHHEQSNAQTMYWHSSRRRRLTPEADGDRGTEVFLTLVDLDSQPQNLQDWTLHVSTTCCNRDMVAKLPFGRGRPKATLRNAGAAVKVEFLTPPTATLRPVVPDQYYWRLLSHLSMNHLSLSDTASGAEAVREILSLYNAHGSDETKRAIQAIEKISYSRDVGRLPADVGTGFCRGLRIEVIVDEERLVGMGRYLFATILDHFFSQMATINSFTRLIVRESVGQTILFDGQPRAGDRYLL